jgi:catechol 2,3-dioxygenase-like lactoylglutathione lyase family enzyme
VSYTGDVHVRRIVANIAAANPETAKRFYADLFGLDVLMDMGWILTFGAAQQMTLQLSVMSEGGSGTPVPGLSIEVDDLDEALARAQRMNLALEYGPVDEPWGVRRFFVRDPFGTLVNVLAHAR